MGQLINISEIKTLYPDEWVLLGNPVMDDSKIDVLSGIPLFHSKDKKEIANNFSELKKGYETTACIYTGELSNNRKFWL